LPALPSLPGVRQLWPEEEAVTEAADSEVAASEDAEDVILVAVVSGDGTSVAMDETVVCGAETVAVPAPAVKLSEAVLVVVLLKLPVYPRESSAPAPIRPTTGAGARFPPTGSGI